MAISTCAGECKLTFTSLGAFDKHQRMTPESVICLPPATVGLEQRDNGVWGFPKGSFTFGSPADVDKPDPKVYDCACGKQFRGTGKRGRPPTRCTDCGGKGIIDV